MDGASFRTQAGEAYMWNTPIYYAQTLKNSSWLDNARYYINSNKLNQSMGAYAGGDITSPSYGSMLRGSSGQIKLRQQCRKRLVTFAVHTFDYVLNLAFKIDLVGGNNKTSIIYLQCKHICPLTTK